MGNRGKRRISAKRGREFLEQPAKLNFKMDGPLPISEFPRLHALATIYQLTAYDAAYLDLAKRLALPRHAEKEGYSNEQSTYSS